jgi:hypothetical protein
MSSKRPPIWPTTGDKVFVRAPTSEMREFLETNFFPMPGVYTESFRLAAESVIDAAESTLRNFRDWLVFPILYLYRHYLELLFKDFIREGMQNTTIMVDGQWLNKSHNLRDLWQKTREYIEAVFPDGDAAELELVQGTVLAFHDLDPTGQTFRYATDRKGNPHLTYAQANIDLPNLKRVMANLQKYFEATDAGMAYRQ